ncbi:MAG: class I SAM-dependent methyltransferase [Magnetococcales bacterium]|nr:class I SAM-dependent methyltransferase [Magnetococcales bacterium]
MSPPNFFSDLAVPFTNLPLPNAIWILDESSRQRAIQWAERLGLPWIDRHTPDDRHPIFALNQGRLELHLGRTGRKGGIHAEFSLRKARQIIRQEGKNSLLARAIGLRKHPDATILDATAGLGRDGFLLAVHGCTVHLCERSPMVAALLRDGLERGMNDPDTAFIIREHIRLHEGNARSLLVSFSSPASMTLPATESNISAPSPPIPVRADVVYLDPMFTTTANAPRAKKDIQGLRLILGPDNDARELLQPALDHARRRVVVKRSLKSPPLGDRTPDFSIRGTTIRYDVYLSEVS